MRTNLFRQFLVAPPLSAFICGHLWFVLGINAAPAGPETIISVAPQEDTNAMLHNPSMGWVIYENFPVDPDPHGSSTMLTLPDDNFPEADVVAI
ncbi:MAG TPA: hypothetical protein VFA77_06200, partial [Candidatus Eisenbacteria bacterium]|nr:hypothetical protein [Candidatus Eisenbacteria bacterium]